MDIKRTFNKSSNLLIHLLKTNYLIICIALLAMTLRFYGLFDRGLFLWDSCFYANIAKTPFYAFNYLAENRFHFQTSHLIDYLINNGCVVMGVKPGYVFLIFISMLLFGVCDFAVLLPSATSGVLTIIMVYAIGKRFFSKEMGIISSLFLVFSGFHIAISRLGWPQSATIFFGTLFIYNYFAYCQKQKKINLYAASFIIGINTLFHISFYIVAIPIVFDFIANYFKKKFTIDKKDILYCFIFIISPLMLFESLFFIINLIPSNFEIISILSFLLKQSSGINAAETSFTIVDSLVFFYKMITEADGIIYFSMIVSFIVISSIFAIKTKNKLSIILIVQIIVPIIIWAWKYPTIKAIGVCYPSVALIIGYSIFEIFKKLKYRNIFIYFFCFLIIVSANYDFIVNQLKFEVQYKQIILKIKRIVNENGGNFYAENQENLTEVLHYYMPLISDNENGIEFKGPKKISYKIIDYRVMNEGPDYVKEIRSQGDLVFKVKLFNKFLPIYHYHRLKNNGYEYIKRNFTEDWLYLYVYSIPNKSL